MDCQKVGSLILKLRHEKNMTQRALAQQMGISDKAISKWERGLGCPDVSLLAQLGSVLGVNIEDILEGELPPEQAMGGNMKNTKYFVCPTCGSVTLSTGNTAVSCCKRRLSQILPQKAQPEQRLRVEELENDWFISADHPMTKEDYVSFVCFSTGDRVQLVKQYPEWNLQLRIPRRGHGMLFWYSEREGLLYQLI